MEIRDLIRRFETEHDRFTKVSYNETQRVTNANKWLPIIQNELNSN